MSSFDRMEFNPFTCSVISCRGLLCAFNIGLIELSSDHVPAEFSLLVDLSHRCYGYAQLCEQFVKEPCKSLPPVQQSVCVTYIRGSFVVHACMHGSLRNLYH